MLQRVAVCCSVLQWLTSASEAFDSMRANSRCVVEGIAVRCSVLQCAAVCCSASQCVAGCCSV